MLILRISIPLMDNFQQLVFTSFSRTELDKFSFFFYLFFFFFFFFHFYRIDQMYLNTLDLVVEIIVALIVL